MFIVNAWNWLVDTTAEWSFLGVLIRLLLALIVGLIIGIFQALTQIQEMTLAFVPKILCVFLALVVLFPFMYGQMQTLSDSLFSKIAGG